MNKNTKLCPLRVIDLKQRKKYFGFHTLLYDKKSSIFRRSKNNIYVTIEMTFLYTICIKWT